MTIRTILAIPLLLICLTAGAQVSHSIFLVGDCGEPYVEKDPLGEIIRKNISGAAPHATVLFLGDNIYPKGLPFEGERLRAEGEAALQHQVDWIAGLQARGIFIPGNHDWHHWGRKGFGYILNQQNYLDSLKNEQIGLLPRDGCPGPVEVAIDPGTLLVIIDTQWILHQWEKPGESSSCRAKTTAGLMVVLDDIFQRNKGKRIIIAGHHPAITYGEHGGVFTLKAHLFPLQELSDHLYIPLPIIGSVYPLYRKWFGHIQDTPHPSNKDFTRPLMDIMARNPGSVYVSGHEHALEYITRDSSHFIVSGSGAKVEYVREKKYARYAKAVRGFVQVNVMLDKSLELLFHRVDNEFPQGNIVFRQLIPPVRSTRGEDEMATTIAPGTEIAAPVRGSAEALRGSPSTDDYSEHWRTSVNAPVLDLAKEGDGLSILRREGSLETISLRLQDTNGREYTLQAVEQHPEGALPDVLQRRFEPDPRPGSISSTHPYARLAAGALSPKAGIGGRAPKLWYVPPQPGLGVYQKLVGNKLATLEQHPEQSMTTEKVRQQIELDHRNRADQEAVLRARLFDMLVGDWDRHDDQWEWRVVSGNGGKTFQPIPRNHDEAFFVSSGFSGRLWSRRWAYPMLEGFDEDVDWAPGLAYKARHFDRTFLNHLGKDQWLRIARELRDTLTDAALDNALAALPEEVYIRDQRKILSHLKSRRDGLTATAESHYRFLASVVDVKGSHEPDHFKVERLSNGDVSVRISNLKSATGEQTFYERIFHKSETRELRLYGLGHDDLFQIQGTARKSILVRVVGGPGSDTLIDRSMLKGAGKQTVFYDQRGPNFFSGGKNVKDRRQDAEVTRHDEKSFDYDRFAPLIIAGYNPDDGVSFGGGFSSTTEGFRKDPFEEHHVLSGTFAPLTRSYNFEYRGIFTELLGKLDFDLHIRLKPNYVNNFFGLGNETEFDQDVDYYRYAFQEVRIDPTLVRKFSNWGKLRAGPALQRVQVTNSYDNQKFIDLFADEGPNPFYETAFFGGLGWGIEVDQRDDPQHTSNGAHFSLSGRNLRGFNSSTSAFSSYETFLALYYRFRKPRQLGLAFRAGGGLNTGDFEFYQAQILDGKSELRGYRKNRFYGDKKIFTNTEVRLQIARFKSYLRPTTLGLLLFYDGGRVWYSDATGGDPSADGQKSGVWHGGWGGGMWFTPFNLTTLSAEFAQSTEGSMFYVRMGFLF